MSEDAAINSLRSLCLQAEKDVLKTRNNLDKMQKRLVELENKYTTLKQALEHVSKATDSKPRSFHDEVYEVIASAGEAGISMRNIQSKLLEHGKLDANNPAATVHVAVSRLTVHGVIESVEVSDEKLFRRKSAKPPEPDQNS